MDVNQPIPIVTAADVERVTRRDFPSEQYDLALSLLSEYGNERWHREMHRVRLAVLKLADGKLENLRRELQTAKCDYRDVLAGAEYPTYMKRTFRMEELSVRERRNIIDEDWKQYDSWFKK